MAKLLGHESELHDKFKGKRLRDEIHIDVHFSQLEMKVIDTPEFQRLDGLKQLGTTYLLYRNAKHTRFEHAIGVVATTQQMIDIINSKAPSLGTEVIPPEAEVIARMCALLHDIGHLPFGHSLEEEAKVIKTRHDSLGRVNKKIGEGTPIGNILGKELREVVISTLTAKDEDLGKLKFPYVADIVANTICADLLDYIQRDLQNTGLRSSFDPRFLSYLVLAKDKKGRKRIAIRLWRRKARGVRQEVITDIVSLLKLRSMLAEKVYYHPNKMLTSAMISRAVQASGMTEDRLMVLKDEDLLRELSNPEKTNNGLANKLANRLVNRELYKALYWISKVDENDTDRRWTEQKALAKEFCESPNCADNKARFENKLEKLAGLEPGSCIIYCPDFKMQLKSAKVLVELPDEPAIPLEEVNSKDIWDAVEQVKKQHKKLWKFYVFVDSKYFDNDVVTDQAEWINSACMEVFGSSNDNTLFKRTGQTPYERWVIKVCVQEKAPDVIPALLSSKSKLEGDKFVDDPEGFIKTQLKALLSKKEEPKKML